MNGTHFLPAQDRVILAFEDLLSRLAKVEPDTAAVFPAALEAATNWTVAGEKPEDMAVALSSFFFEMLEALARRMQEGEG